MKKKQWAVGYKPTQESRVGSCGSWFRDSDYDVCSGNKDERWLFDRKKDAFTVARWFKFHNSCHYAVVRVR